MKTTFKLVAALALTASFFSASAQGDDKAAKKEAKMAAKEDKKLKHKAGDDKELKKEAKDMKKEDKAASKM